MIKTVAPVCLAVLFASTVMADSGDTPHALVLSAALARATASPLLAIDQNRVTVVDRIVAQWGEALSRSDAGVGSEQLREMLMSMRADQLLAASLAGSLDGLRNVVAAALVSEGDVKRSLLHAKTLGDPDRDVVYQPVVPCRLVETRGTFAAVYQGGGSFTAGQTRTYTLQGGNGVCLTQLPPSLTPTAIQLQVFGIPTTTGSGDIEILPQGGTFGSTATLVFLGNNLFTSAAATSLANLANKQISVQVRGAGAHVAIDVVGYFRAPAGGYVSSVTAGTGLTGGGSGAVTLAVDTLAVQARVTGTCAVGSSIRAIAANGAVTCETDDVGGTGTVTSVGSGTGLTGGPITTSGTLSADTAFLQRRVSTACAVGSSIRAIAADGTVTCQTDNVGPANAFVQSGNAFGATGVLGTTDNNALDLRVNGSRVMRYEPNAISPNVIGGSFVNNVTAGVRGATIAGGGVPAGNTDPDFNDEAPNRVTDVYGTVTGGYANRAGDNAGSVTDRGFATVSGGSVNTASGVASTVGGGSTNTASGTGSTVGGGLLNGATGDVSAVAGGNGNSASGEFSTVAGGFSNTASGSRSAIVGGSSNIASLDHSAIGGGFTNAAGGVGSAIAGGLFNAASGWSSAIAGGESNAASATYSMVPGGFDNTASGNASFAAGTMANADANGCFVWNDNSGGSISCGGPGAGANRVVMRATGGFIFITSVNNTVGAQLLPGANAWSIYSDRHYKDHMRAVDARLVLDRLLDLPITTWNWKSQDAAVLHMGPTAQDFHAAFGLGETPTMINTVDVSGVALAAIKGLNAKLEAEVAEQAREIGELRRAVEVLLERTSTHGTLASIR